MYYIFLSDPISGKYWISPFLTASDQLEDEFLSISGPIE
jgi:hypothetical protein